MSDDIPERDAEDVLRVIRDDAGHRGPDAGSPAPEVGENGTFLLTSVHRIEDSEDDGEGRRGADPIPFKRPPWQKGPGDVRRPSGPQKWAGPDAPSRVTLGEKRAAPPTPAAVPGLEDPSDGSDTSRSGEKPEPLQADPRAESARSRTSLDEAAVRRIVEEILDERLQGELGRRITRNLKQLVRREVARSLEDRSD